MSRHHRRDSGKVQNSWLAAIGGFLVIPTVVGAAAGMAAKSALDTNPLVGAQILIGAHGLALAGSWWASKKYPQARSFFRGGTVGEAASVVSVSVVASALSSQKTSAPTVASPGVSAQLQSLGTKLATAGWFKH